jgi:hypothetical protein
MYRLLLAGVLPALACASGTPFAADYTLAFGAVKVGAPVTRTLDLTNVSGQATTIESIDLPTDLEFTPEQPTPTSVAAGEVLSVPVTFKPFSVGPKSSSLVLHTDSSERPTIQVALTGAGGTPCLQLSSAVLDFGSVVVNSSAVRLLGLLNCGDLDLQVTPTEIEGPSAGLFHLEGSPSVVPVGKSESLQISYSPSAPTAQDVAYFVISLTSVSPSNPTTIALQGSAVSTSLAVSPNPLDCGSSVPAGTTLEFNLRIANVANEVVTVSTVDVSDPGSPAAFFLAPSSWKGGMINPGDSVGVTLSFDPSVPGNYTGGLDIRSNDVAGRVSVKLTCAAGS